jgi:putative protease
MGMRINRAEGDKLFPAEMPEELTEGATLFRNRDQVRAGAGKDSAERRISLKPVLTETDDGFVLTLTDEDGVTASAALPRSEQIGSELAQNPNRRWPSSRKTSASSATRCSSPNRSNCN